MQVFYYSVKLNRVKNKRIFSVSYQAAGNQIDRINHKIGSLVHDSLSWKNLRRRGRPSGKSKAAAAKSSAGASSKPRATPKAQNNGPGGGANAKKRGRPPGRKQKINVGIIFFFASARLSTVK